MTPATEPPELPELPGMPEAVVRPMRPDDAEAVAGLVNVCDRADVGEETCEVADVHADWARTTFDLAADSVGVWRDGALVALGEVHRERAEVCVRPDVRGRGVGTAVAAWTEARARANGAATVGQTVPETATDAVALLAARGYARRWTSWVLALPADATIEPVDLPAGYALREAVPGEDDRVAHEVVEGAFGEWPDRQPVPFEDWAPSVVGRDGFAPWQLRLATYDGGSPAGPEVVGVCHVLVDGGGVGWVDELAVRADHRGRGLARALLVDGFAATTAHGGRGAELNTDSRTGALGLYERVGMRPRLTYVHLALPLAAARPPTDIDP